MGLTLLLTSDGVDLNTAMGIMSVMTTMIQQDNKQNNAMEELLKACPKTFLKEGDLVDGAVLTKESARLYVDLGIFGTGIIYGREYQNARDFIKKLNSINFIKYIIN